ncbi:MAG: diguanylate cyclase, partial [Azonexus sp.]|nr:diguanylate cyclase [Azonexus sp.]
AVAERMRLAIRELCIPHEKGIAGLVSCSFGVASVIPSGESSAAGLVALADAALYQAKQHGRNRVQINDRQMVTAD